MAAILPHTDGGLLTADNCALVFIDHQPQMGFGVANGLDRQQLVNNVLLLAKGAQEFGVPTILTTVETESFSGPMWPELLDVFPEQEPIERTSMNSWDSSEFREAIQATGKKNILLSGLWTEVCICWPTLNMLWRRLQHLHRRRCLRRHLAGGTRSRTLADGASGSGSNDDDRNGSGVPTRLGQPRALRRADAFDASARRRLRNGNRILLHDGAQGSTSPQGTRLSTARLVNRQALATLASFATRASLPAPLHRPLSVEPYDA